MDEAARRYCQVPKAGQADTFLLAITLGMPLILELPDLRLPPLLCSCVQRSMLVSGALGRID
jgi:hypothetical protein